MKTFLIENAALLQSVANISFTISLAISIPAYFYNSIKERKRKSMEVYRNLTDSYFQTLCIILENSELDLYDDNLKKTDNTESDRKRKIIYSMLISLFEKAYVFFNSEDKWIQTRFWNDWVGYMRDWVNRKSFQQYLKDCLKNDDSEFSDFLVKLINK